jgi:hypothetical protein
MLDGEQHQGEVPGFLDKILTEPVEHMLQVETPELEQAVQVAQLALVAVPEQ